MNVGSALHALMGLAPRQVRAAFEDRGQGLVEYAVILSLVVIGLLLVTSVMGGQTAGMIFNVSNGFHNQ